MRSAHLHLSKVRTVFAVFFIFSMMQNMVTQQNL